MSLGDQETKRYMSDCKEKRPHVTGTKNMRIIEQNDTCQTAKTKDPMSLEQRT